MVIQMKKNNTFYFKRKNKRKTLVKELSNTIAFGNKFTLNKNVYLENENYLIVVAKHFIRVLVFNDDKNSVSYIQNIINRLNTSKT